MDTLQVAGSVWPITKKQSGILMLKSIDLLIKNGVTQIAKLNSREKNRRISNPDKSIDSVKKYVSRLGDGYVAYSMSLKLSECSPELIELKRKQLRIHRLTKQLKQEIKNV